MGHYTYYCEVARSCEDIATGVYSIITDKEINGRWFPQLNRIITVSNRVWKQGPKGGVKIVKSREWPWPMGYVTTDEKYMKQFAWVKLRAKAVNG